MWRKLPGEGKLYYLLCGTLVIYVLFVRMGILGLRITSFEDTACIFRRYRQSFDMDTEIVTHNGGCHCQKVRWQAQAPTRVVAWECNCSNCSMRMNTHFVVPVERFRLSEDSKQFLTTYTFGTLTAKHTFCKVCGITSFYYPRSNPDGVAITYRCVERGTLTHVEIKQYDGKNWESSYNQSGIASCSKV